MNLSAAYCQAVLNGQHELADKIKKKLNGEIDSEELVRFGLIKDSAPETKTEPEVENINTKKAKVERDDAWFDMFFSRTKQAKRKREFTKEELARQRREKEQRDREEQSVRAEFYGCGEQWNEREEMRRQKQETFRDVFDTSW